MSLLLLLALVLLALLFALLLFLRLPRGPPRGRLGLHVAQKSATREAGALDFGCGCACSGGGGGAARGAKGGRVANFSLTAPNLLWRWRWCWRSPRVRHARGWGFALPRSQPRGKLGLYVAQKHATREANALRSPDARHARGWGFRFWFSVVVRRGEESEEQLPPPSRPQVCRGGCVGVGVGVAKTPATRGRGLLYVAQKSATRGAGDLGFGFGCGGGAARGSKRGATSPFLTAPSLQWWLCWCWCCPNARHTGGEGGVCDATLPRGPPRGMRLPRSPPRGRLDL